MHHARLYYFVTGFVAGVALPSFVPFTMFWAVFLWCAIVCTVIAIAQSRFYRHSTNLVRVSRTVFFGCFILGCASGILRTTISYSQNNPATYADFAGCQVVLKGNVLEEPAVSDTSVALTVGIKDLTCDKIAVKNFPPKILVRVALHSTYHYGDVLHIEGVLQKPAPIIDETGRVFAYDTYLYHKGIFFLMTYPKVTVLAEHQGNVIVGALYSVKEVFVEKISAMLPYPESGLLAGLLVSGNTSLGANEKTEFTRAGLIHVIALSGFNVTIVAQALMFMLVFLPIKLRRTVGALGIIAFTLMTGFTATVLRAALMALIVLFSQSVHRVSSAGRSLFITVFLLLIYNPFLVYDVSFELSCIATFALIFCAPPFITILLPRLPKLFLKFRIGEILISTIAIELSLAPLILYYSGTLSILSPVTNLLVPPLLPALMFVGFFATIIFWILPIVAFPLILVTEAGLAYILKVVEIASSLPFGVLTISVPLWSVFFLYGILVLFWRLVIKNAALKIKAASPKTV